MLGSHAIMISGIMVRELALILLIGISCSSVSSEAGVNYSRGDQNAYLRARGDQEPSTHLDPSHYKLIRQKLTHSANRLSYDDPIKCTTYLAESSIPNSGLGLYTSIPYEKDELIGHSEAGVLMQDPDFHNPPNPYRFNLLSNYVWSATPLTFGEHEVAHGESVCTGMGLMCNCHFGLVNVDHSSSWKMDSWRDGTDTLAVEGGKHATLSDVGRGSYTWHGNVRFESKRPIRAGEEMFISYGPQWYEHAAKEFGGVVPSAGHWKEADVGLRNFVKQLEDSSGKKWEEIPGRQELYDALLKKAEARDERLRAALPNNVEDVPKAIQMGTARFSTPDSIRSLRWLQDNGACLDGIVGGTSSIPQAGQGAFATRSIKQGGIITTTPVLTLDRDALKLRKEIKRKDGTVRSRHAGYQLLLNYCYGHPESSLVFLPTAPGVNFINHGSKEDANAEIRWSKLPYHKSTWLNSTLEEMKRLEMTGLLFDIVATKDIQRGDEILIYYGDSWVESWNQHIGSWESSPKNFTDTKGVNTTVDFNHIGKDDILRTVEELKTNPYPDHLMTYCKFALPESMSTSNTDKVENAQINNPKRYPCDVLERNPIEGTDRYLYKVKVDYTPDGSNEMTMYAVILDSDQEFHSVVDKPYTRDYYSKGAFRQTIGLDDGIVPNHWKDLRRDD